MVEEYPRNLTELEANFSTEAACRAYLARLRWPDGFRCPRCGGTHSWPVRELLLECAGCGCQTSVTAGTIFQDTRTPLPVWFRAMWWVTTQKNGASALGLQRVLGLKKYETAWTWLHKLRGAMVRPGRDLLTGRVEVDETYLGGSEKGILGRQIEEKALIIVAAQEDGKRIGRIRMRQIPDGSAESLRAFLVDVIQPGMVIHTDGWRGYSGATSGFVHEVTKLKKYMEPASELTWLDKNLQNAVTPPPSREPATTPNREAAPNPVPSPQSLFPAVPDPRSLTPDPCFPAPSPQTPRPLPRAPGSRPPAPAAQPLRPVCTRSGRPRIH